MMKKLFTLIMTCSLMHMSMAEDASAPVTDTPNPVKQKFQKMLSEDDNAQVGAILKKDEMTKIKKNGGIIQDSVPQQKLKSDYKPANMYNLQSQSVLQSIDIQDIDNGTYQSKPTPRFERFTIAP